MKINKEWHLKHPMPSKPTVAQKIEWHLEHRKHCRCRDILGKLKDEMNKLNINIPA